jgi:hypothetical protein
MSKAHSYPGRSDTGSPRHRMPARPLVDASFTSTVPYAAYVPEPGNTFRPGFQGTPNPAVAWVSK